MVRVSGKVWFVGLLVLGLIASLLGAAPPGAVGTHGDDADVDYEPSYSACVGAATESFGFEDTEGSFAEGAIDCLAHYGITTGRSATMFAPNDSVLRWQMALFLARAAAAAGIVLANPAADQGFTDVGAVSGEARNAINGLAAAGIMPGVSQSAFSPNASVTRGSMAVLLDAFLAAATPGAGAFGGEIEKYSDVMVDSSNVFNDISGVSLNTYNAIYRIYEVGVTQGVGDHQFGPGRNVTRAQMAAFITRAFAHTVARPAGVSIQAERDSVLGESSVQLIVSVRDAMFQPVVDASVDVFRSTDPDNALNDDGRCDTASVSPVAGIGRAACEVDTGDETTDAAGDVTALQLQVSDADVTVWAWTGDRDDKFDSDDTTAAQLTVGFSKAASQTLVTDNLEEGQTRLAFGETVTVTIQIADEDDKAVADKGKRVTVEQETTIGTSTTSSNNAMTTDASGKIVLEFTQTDPNTNTGDTAELELTLSGAPSDLPLRNEDGTAFSSKTYIWSDETPVPRALTLSTRSDFGMASDEGSGAGNTVTATLTDQFGDPVRGKRVSFFSDTYCTPAQEGSTCSPPGIGVTESGGASVKEDDGVRVLTGTARFTRTTGRDGKANLGYTYDSTDSVIETIWATYPLAGNEGPIVRGFADTVVECGEDGALPAGRCRPENDPADLTELTAERIYYYWVEDPSGAPFTGRILVKEPENNQLVVAAEEKLMLVEYDGNDQFVDFDGPTVLSEFEKPLAENADPGAAHLRVDFYQEEAGKVSKFTLSPEWSSLDHPDGPEAGARARFGQAVAVDNGVIVVGAGWQSVVDDMGTANDPSDDVTRANAGMAYIYPNGMGTAAANIIKLVPPTPTAESRFGFDVDIAGNVIVVGSFSHGTNGLREVYVYQRGSDGVWPKTPSTTLSPGPGDVNLPGGGKVPAAGSSTYGSGVAISKDESTIAVNMGWVWPLPRIPNVATVVYERTGASWDSDDNDSDASDNALLWNHWWGVWNDRSVSISKDGSVIVIGSPNWSSETPDAGSVGVFVKPMSGWAIARTATANLKAPTESAFQRMGKYVAVSEDGNTVVASGHFDAGATFNGQPIDEPGVILVFSKPATGWADGVAPASLSASRGRVDDVLGQYIAITSDGSEVAGSRHYRQEGDMRGSVVVYKRPAGGWADDSTPDDEFLGPRVNVRLGWQTTYDRTNNDLYSGLREKNTVEGLDFPRLLTVYQITR